MNEIVDVIRVCEPWNGDMRFGYEVLYEDGRKVIFWCNECVSSEVLLADYIFNGSSFF